MTGKREPGWVKQITQGHHAKDNAIGSRSGHSSVQRLLLHPQQPVPGDRKGASRGLPLRPTKLEGWVGPTRNNHHPGQTRKHLVFPADPAGTPDQLPHAPPPTSHAGSQDMTATTARPTCHHGACNHSTTQPTPTPTGSKSGQSHANLGCIAFGRTCSAHSSTRHPWPKPRQESGPR